MMFEDYQDLLTTRNWFVSLLEEKLEPLELVTSKDTWSFADVKEWAELKICLDRLLYTWRLLVARDQTTSNIAAKRVMCCATLYPITEELEDRENVRIWLRYMRLCLVANLSYLLHETIKMCLLESSSIIRDYNGSPVSYDPHELGKLSVFGCTEQLDLAKRQELGKRLKDCMKTMFGGAVTQKVVGSMDTQEIELLFSMSLEAEWTYLSCYDYLTDIPWMSPSKEDLSDGLRESFGLQAKNRLKLITSELVNNSKLSYAEWMNVGTSPNSEENPWMNYQICDEDILDDYDPWTGADCDETCMY